jgi:hypothetical protein
MFLDMDLYRDQIFPDEVFNPLIGIDLGIQPSACSSHGSSVEVEHQGAVLLLGLRERFINVMYPIDRHVGIERCAVAPVARL